MFKKTLAAASLGAILATTPVAARDTDDTSINITYDDLDLTSDKGRQQLDQRITLAARKACGLDRHTTGTRTTTRDQRRCVASVEKQAKVEIARVIEEEQLGG